MKNHRFSYQVVFSFVVLGLGMAVGLVYAEFGRDMQERAYAEQLFVTAPKRLIYLSSSRLTELAGKAFEAGFATVTSPEAVLQIDANSPVDGVMIDSSLVDEIDTNWIRSRFEKGMAVGGVNMTMVELAKLVDYPLESPWSDPVTDGPYMVIFQIQVTSNDPLDIKRFWAQSSVREKLESTGLPDGLSGSSLSISVLKMAYNLSVPEMRDAGFNDFEKNITSIHRFADGK